MCFFNTFLFAFSITIIGSLPFGLVNLTVSDTAYRNGISSATKVAFGASFIEIIYGLIALITGSYISNYIHINKGIRILALVIPFVVGIIFFFRKTKTMAIEKNNNSGVLYGMILNLISVQMFLFWLAAITYSQKFVNFGLSANEIIFFVIGIWLGKMLVLWLYANFTKYINRKSDFIAKNVNRIIGTVMILSVVIQLYQ